MVDVGYPDGSTDFAALSPEEREFAQWIQGWWMREGAFNMIQLDQAAEPGVRPQRFAGGARCLAHDPLLPAALPRRSKSASVSTSSSPTR